VNTTDCFVASVWNKGSGTIQSILNVPTTNRTGSGIRVEQWPCFTILWIFCYFFSILVIQSVKSGKFMKIHSGKNCQEWIFMCFFYILDFLFILFKKTWKNCLWMVIHSDNKKQRLPNRNGGYDGPRIVVVFLWRWSVGSPCVPNLSQKVGEILWKNMDL
jgi:hypothetical protein